MQPQTPYLDALRAYAARSPGRFHVPGHKGGAAADPVLAEAFGERALELDIPALTEGIDAGPEPTPFQRAQELAAQAWGAARTWFLINGASQGNHAACVALAQGGEQVVVQRNVHSSTIDGLVVSGLRPVFVAPEIDPELGIAHCVTPEALDRALAGSPGAVGAMVVSPTYFGAVADVQGLAGVAHRHGVPLVVDEAWGAHLAFGPSLPRHALACGADLVVSSTHKIIGSFTQSAMLHLGARRAARRARRGPRDHLAGVDQPELAAVRLAGRGTGVRGRERRAPARGDGARARRSRGRRSRASRASTCWTRVSPSGRACTPTTRCDSSSTCGARA